MNNNIKIGEDSFISKDSVLTGKVKIGNNSKIVSSTLCDCTIKDNVIITNSTIENSLIEADVSIGPYAHIRPNCKIKQKVHIGNFVEIKNSIIGARTKIPHLTYVGDADIGEDVNIGCGVVFCNYDGKEKYRSTVGDRVFIGSNSNIIAPVNIENNSFIAAGSTITKDVLNSEMAMSRTRQENKKLANNPYIFNFESEPKLFGTDGIRGIYSKTLTNELCTKIGYAIGKLKPNAKILIASDTRPSGKEVLKNLCLGLCHHKTEIYFAGILSTAGLSYLTRINNFDFGIMITASHNPSEYNGIKIFNHKGHKINKNIEKMIEKSLYLPTKTKKYEIRDFSNKQYLDFLSCFAKKVHDKTDIFIDCANGAISNYAKKILEQTGAKIISKNMAGEINKNASILDEKLFQKNFQKSNCEIGFCFDGDADRIMMITKDFGVFDGDKILFILAKHFKEKSVVGTIMTNLGVEKAIKQNHINLYRVSVGDRNIAKLLSQKGYNIGAEQSGHVILHNYHTTGDGLLTALILIDIWNTNKNLFEKASKIKIYPTFNDKISTDNKDIIKSKKVKDFLEKTQKFLGKKGRVILRPSGTEPVIRITVESEDKSLAKRTCKNIKNFIQNLVSK